ncbi:phosphoribosylglycinamide formyltransferase [Calderihabitans maritimus]|uniref:Phosphoribosylglycinamide formyltransferase n=1 Tax=Calderihabitans maritimus TaxID=1246530 RepID=A0A1Z5HS66_9FIRM|nr:phosphoribosylglycinamide formyltransferase [Calderihabitans maritimus]GAW92165.1 phosphoribosylglycinamide formyltransferase [Calderihabitans maritimus]
MGLLKLGVLASGRGSNLQAIIDAIERNELDASIEVVISNRAGAKALERAKNHNIPAIYVDPKEYTGKEEYDLALVKVLKRYEVELVVLAGFMRLLTPRFIEHFPNRIVNIHPSLLPAFPGLEAQKQAWEYGVRYSGCTVHFVDENMDTGPIIDQEVVPVYQDDTAETLAERILEREHRLYPRVLQWIAEGRVKVRGRKVYISGLSNERNDTA